MMEFLNGFVLGGVSSKQGCCSAKSSENLYPVNRQKVPNSKHADTFIHQAGTHVLGIYGISVSPFAPSSGIYRFV
jgi:hypothetical protein